MLTFFKKIVYSRWVLFLIALSTCEIIGTVIGYLVTIAEIDYLWYLYSLYTTDILLFFYIFYYFFKFIKQKTNLAVLEYINSLVFGFIMYILSSFELTSVGIVTQTLIMPSGESIGETVPEIDGGIFYGRCVLVFFAIVFLYLLYWEFINKNFFILELPFLVALLLWVFCISLFNFNFLFLFLLMEAITLLVVVIAAIFFIFFGAKLLKPVIQFFVLNLVVSTFYILGLGLFFFFIPVSSSTNLSYITFFISFWVYSLWALVEPTILIAAFKLVIWFFLMPFLFKLTLAPFAFWVIQIYSKLPVVILLLLMGVYKFVYILLFLKLFIYIISLLAAFKITISLSVILFILPSMFIGCLAYRSADLKTILAFTTVSQLGYIMSAFIVHDAAALRYGILYLIVYMLNLAGVFIVFILIQKRFFLVNINQLFLIKYYSKKWFYITFILFASLAGFPPFAGFYLKYFLFLHIYKAGFFGLSIAGLISSYIMAIIYLQLLVELAMPKNVVDSLPQLSGLGDLIEVAPNFIDRLRVQRQIRWIFNFFLGLISIIGFINISFFWLLPIFSGLSGWFIYYFIYGLPLFPEDSYENEWIAWLSGSYFSKELEWTSDFVAIGASERLQTLWKCAILDNINLDRSLSLLLSQAEFEKASVDFVRDGQRYVIPANATSAIHATAVSRLKLPWMPLEIADEWYIDMSVTKARQGCKVWHDFTIFAFSLEDYVNFYDRLSADTRQLLGLNFIESDIDYVTVYNAHSTLLQNTNLVDRRWDTLYKRLR